jgi:hypothetical protein
MPVPKGTRFGGRAKGTMNKATRERLEAERIAEQARKEVDDAYNRNKKLGKDMLEQYMMAFHGIAAIHQNNIAQAVSAGQEIAPADLAGFKEWGKLVVDTADKLADYQSPRFKAIAVVAPPPSANGTELKRGDDNIYRLDDPVMISKVYANLIRKAG